MEKILLSILVTVTLSGCGIKPGSVKPPTDATGIYPRVYPNPETTDQGPKLAPPIVKKDKDPDVTE